MIPPFALAGRVGLLPDPPKIRHNSDILPRGRRRCRVVCSQDIKRGAFRLPDPWDIRVGQVRQIGKDLVRKRRAVGARRTGQPATVIELEQAEVITGSDGEVALEGAVRDDDRVRLREAEGSTRLDVDNLSTRNRDILRQGPSQ